VRRIRTLTAAALVAAAWLIAVRAARPRVALGAAPAAAVLACLGGLVLVAAAEPR
jgi:hypothetical protein